MDAEWFKLQQKKAGITADRIAAEMGRDRSAVSHIYTGRRRMSLDWAKAFARALSVPLDEVLAHAGALDEDDRAPLRIGLAEGDVAPFKGPAARMVSFIETLGGGRPGIDVWTVAGRALQLLGYMPGDNILVDTQQSERAQAGDVVIAQCYDATTGSARTVLRQFQPPVLISASADPDDAAVHVVDGRNVVIRGRVIAAWRTARK